MKEPLNVLVVEDSPADMRLVCEAMGALGGQVSVDCVRDGQAALESLRRRSDAGPEVPPDVVLLDLNLPVLDGRELLMELRRDTRLRDLPVVIMSSSASQRAISECYALNISSYILKPLDADSFMGMIRVFVEYWRLVVSAPKSRRDAWQKKR